MKCRDILQDVIDHQPYRRARQKPIHMQAWCGNTFQNEATFQQQCPFVRRGQHRKGAVARLGSKQQIHGAGHDRVIPSQKSDLIAAERVRAVCVSWIPTNSGLVQPMSQIAQVCDDLVGALIAQSSILLQTLRENLFERRGQILPE